MARSSDERLAEWWKRDDVRRVLRAHYALCAGEARFIVVGRRHGWLTLTADSVDEVLERLPPLYLGFSVNAWQDTARVLHGDPTSCVIEFDLDNFPDALEDCRCLIEWFDGKGLGHLSYFTGSKGLRVVAGSTGESYRIVKYWVPILCTILQIDSLDMFPYRSVDGWLQPAATLHRKSGLPAYPLDTVPEDYGSVFETATQILQGRGLGPFDTAGLNGELFLQAVQSDFGELAEDDQERVKRGAAALRRKALRPYYER